MKQRLLNHFGRQGDVQPRHLLLPPSCECDFTMRRSLQTSFGHFTLIHHLRSSNKRYSVSGCNEFGNKRIRENQRSHIDEFTKEVVYSVAMITNLYIYISK